MSESAESAARPGPANAWALFRTFARISLYGFGGVLAWTYRILVEERRWMTDAEFNEMLALAQFLPGPNIVNFSVVFGSRLYGPAGAVAALGGLLGVPLVVVIAMGAVYARFGELAALRGALSGVSAAAAGMIIAVVAKLSKPLFVRPFAVGPLIAVICFVAIGVLRWPLVWVLVVLAPLSVALAYWRRA